MIANNSTVIDEMEKLLSKGFVCYGYRKTKKISEQVRTFHK